MQRGRIVLIFVAVAALLGGGLYYVFGVHLPGKARAGARAEIERWEDRLAKAHRCLLGDTPYSPKLAEQRAIFELANEIGDRKACRPLITELARSDGEDTGVEAVERAWSTVEHAVGAVAAGFVSTIDPRGSSDSLVIGLEQLAAAHRALRDAAGMDPLPDSTAKPLAPTELIPLDAKEPIVKLDGWLRPSAGGLIMIGSRAPKNVALDRGANQRQLVLVPGAAPRVTAIAPGVVPSITDPAWGGSAQLATGAIKDGELATAAALPLAKDATAIVLFALGSAADGLIAYVPEIEKGTPRVGIARLVAGKLSAEPLHDAAHYAFALSPPNRGLLAWSSGDKLAGSLIAPGNPNQVVDLGAGDAGPSCLTATHGWVSSRPQFVSFDDAGARPHLLDGDFDLVGCDATSALMHGPGHRYAICTHASCRLAELMARPLAMPALMRGQVIAVASRGTVLAVWREKGPPVFFAIKEPIQIKVVHASAKELDVIGEVEDGFAIVRAAL